MPEESDILRKIKALFQLAESEKALGNVAAAEAIAARANALLLKYKIDRAAVEAEESPADIDAIFITPDEFGEEYMRQRVKWSEDLASVIAGFHFCVTTVAPGTNAISFYGKPNDREVAAYLFCKLARLAKGFCESALEAAEGRLIPYGNGKFLKAESTGRLVNEQSTPLGFGRFGVPEIDVEIIHDLQKWRHRFRDSWHTGFLTGIYQRFDENRKKAEAAAPPGTALVLANALAVVEKAVDIATEGRARAAELKGTGVDKMDKAALVHGHETGRSADISANGLNGGGIPQRLALTEGESND